MDLSEKVITDIINTIEMDSGRDIKTKGYLIGRVLEIMNKEYFFMSESDFKEVVNSNLHAIKREISVTDITGWLYAAKRGYYDKFVRQMNGRKINENHLLVDAVRNSSNDCEFYPKIILWKMDNLNAEYWNEYPAKDLILMLESGDQLDDLQIPLAHQKGNKNGLM